MTRSLWGRLHLHCNHNCSYQRLLFFVNVEQRTIRLLNLWLLNLLVSTYFPDPLYTNPVNRILGNQFNNPISGIYIYIYTYRSEGFPSRVFDPWARWYLGPVRLRSFRVVVVVGLGPNLRISHKTHCTFLLRDYLGTAFSATRLFRGAFFLILIHRKSRETLFLVTRLAQWACPRTGPGVGSGRYQVRFRVRPRLFRILFRILFGHVWECVWDLLGPCGIGLGVLFSFVCLASNA